MVLHLNKCNLHSMSTLKSLKVTLIIVHSSITVVRWVRTGTTAAELLKLAGYPEAGHSYWKLVTRGGLNVKKKDLLFHGETITMTHTPVEVPA